MDVNAIMQQAQVMQRQMLELQEELNQTIVEGVAGDGLVTFRMTGRKEPRGISIDERVLKLPSAGIIEDFIMAAIAAAAEQADTLLSERTEQMVKELGLPPNFQLPA